MRTFSVCWVATILLIIFSSVTRSEEDAEMARKLQNPLANIDAIITENDIGFNTGINEENSYSFLLIPVYPIDLPEYGFNLITRVTLPIMGLEPGTKTRFTGEDGEPKSLEDESVWGLGDTLFQVVLEPESDRSWNLEIGPQISLATHTADDLRGPDWGAGIVLIANGSITNQLTFSGILGNLWSFDGAFNSATIQPMIFYNFDTMPGVYIAYNAVTNIDWKAESSNRWTVPLGLSIGKTINLGDGHGLDLSIGPYYNVARPDGAADWMIRFSINWLIP